MKLIRPIFLQTYGDETAVMDTEQLVRSNIGDKFDYLVIGTDNICRDYDYIVFVGAKIKQTLGGYRIGLRFDKVIVMDKKPSESNIAKELI